MNSFYFFIIGILTAAGTLIFELMASLLVGNFSDQIIFGKISLLIFLAILIEEILKLAVFKKIFFGAHDFAPKIAFFAIGFSFLEIGLNIFKRNGLEYSLLAPYLGILLLHSATIMILGFFIYWKKTLSFSSGTLALFLNLSIHLLFNISVIYKWSPIYPILALIFLISFLFFEKKPT